MLEKQAKHRNQVRRRPLINHDRVRHAVIDGETIVKSHDFVGHHESPTVGQPMHRNDMGNQGTSRADFYVLFQFIPQVSPSILPKAIVHCHSDRRRVPIA